VLTALLLTVVLAVGAVLNSAYAASTPLGVAHRGSQEGCRWTENTIRAFRNCGDAADAIEVDLRLSKNRIPVFIHDATLDRTTTATGRVDARNFGVLRKIPTADGIGRIPSLKVIRNHIDASGQTVFIDVKQYPTAEGWSRIVNQLGPVRSKVIFMSAKDMKYVKKAKGLGFKVAHYSWAYQPVPTVSQVRAYGDYMWRTPLTDAQADTFDDAGIRMIRGGTSWDSFTAQGAWAVNTDFIDSFMDWRSTR
jgi:glycerophosphoryl diester phosphodiesterase